MAREARRTSRSFDAEDLELEGATRRRHLHGLALLPAYDRLADGRLVRQPQLGRIGLGRADDLVLERLPGVDVAQAHQRADRDDVGLDLALLEHPCVPEPLLELRDPLLEQRLLVLRVVVFGVLVDVAEFARLTDSVGNLTPLLVREVLDLLLELLVTLGSEDHFFHLFLLTPNRKSAADQRRRGRACYLRPGMASIATDCASRQSAGPRA